MEKKTEFIDNENGVVKVEVYEPVIEVNRGFKGVWIPKEIWVDTKITWMEKLFFVEIDSLDNDKGCFASNDYFSHFFGISRSRCSQIINKLIKKEYITAKYEREGKEIKRRVLNILNRGIKYTKYPIENIKGGYLENAKENNTLINNTINNIYGSLENVKLTKEEHNKLIEKYGSSIIVDYIERLSLYIPNSKKKYKSHYATLLSWVRKDKVTALPRAHEITNGEPEDV